jgi:hypothetical protein
MPIEVRQLIGGVPLYNDSIFDNTPPLITTMVANNLLLPSQQQLAQQNSPNRIGAKLDDSLIKQSYESGLQPLKALYRSSIIRPRFLETTNHQWSDGLAYLADNAWSLANLVIGPVATTGELIMKGVGSVLSAPFRWARENKEAHMAARVLVGAVGCVGLVAAQPFYLVGNMMTYARRFVDGCANIAISGLSALGNGIRNGMAAVVNGYNKLRNKSNRIAYTDVISKNFTPIGYSTKEAATGGLNLVVTGAVTVAMISPFAPAAAAAIGLAAVGSIACAATTAAGSSITAVSGMSALIDVACSCVKQGLASLSEAFKKNIEKYFQVKQTQKNEAVVTRDSYMQSMRERHAQSQREQRARANARQNASSSTKMILDKASISDPITSASPHSENSEKKTTQPMEAIKPNHNKLFSSRATPSPRESTIFASIRPHTP